MFSLHTKGIVSYILLIAMLYIPLYGEGQSTNTPQAFISSQTTTYPLGFKGKTRTKVIEEYQSEYLNSEYGSEDIEWTGNVANCDPGTISQYAHNKLFQRINYYRDLIGLPSVGHNPLRDPTVQASALLIKASGDASHNPPTHLPCYTPAAGQGSANSLLALGVIGSIAVDQFMLDRGNNNTTAGHRRNLLDSKALTFGHGATDVSEVIFVAGGKTSFPSYTPEFIAWPNAGYTPNTVTPRRWSFGIPIVLGSVDYSNTTVQVKDENNNIVPILLYPYSNSAADRTLVWDMNKENYFQSSEELYTVTVSGVKINAITQPPYIYKVLIINPLEEAEISLSHEQLACNSFTISANFNKTYKSVFWSTGAYTPELINVPSGTYTVNFVDKNDVTYTKTITINADLVHPPSTKVLHVCAGTPVVLPNNCKGDTHVQWFQDQNLSNLITADTLTPSITTNYFGICVSNLDSSCRSTPILQTVLVQQLPEIPQLSALQACEGDLVALQGNCSETGSVLQWFESSNPTQILSQLEIVATPNTTYMANCRDTEELGCQSYYTQFEMEVTPSPQPPMAPSTSILIGTQANLVTSGCTESALWYSDSLNTTLINQGFTFQTPILNTSTTYFVKCISEGCVGKISTPVNVTITTETCPDLIEHHEQAVSGTFNAAKKITGSVSLNNKTEYLAGESITLLPGFSVGGNGEVFEASIEGCAQRGNANN